MPSYVTTIRTTLGTSRPTTFVCYLIDTDLLKLFETQSVFNVPLLIDLVSKVLVDSECI